MSVRPGRDGGGQVRAAPHIVQVRFPVGTGVPQDAQ